MPYSTPPTRPELGTQIDDDWGKDVHDLVYGKIAPLFPSQLASAPPSIYPLGMSIMVITTEAGWPAGYATCVSFCSQAGGWVFQIISAHTGAAVYIRTSVSTTVWSNWTPNLFAVTRRATPK